MKLSRLSRVAGATVLAVGASLLVGLSPAQAAGPAYVALGDSYSSGVGAGEYDDASGDCKRSANAYPQLWANANSPSSFSFTACSGARTGDVLANQLDPVNADTGLVSISIGGNDSGFADAMTTCVLEGESACLSRIQEARSHINSSLPGLLDSVYDAISSRAPSAQVVVLGYPKMYEVGGSCVGGLSEASRTAINDASADLNSVISSRAAAHGFSFGDVRSAFTGHELCSGDAWLHSVTIPIGDSYHPKEPGQSGGYYPVLEGLA